MPFRILDLRASVRSESGTGYSAPGMAIMNERKFALHT